MLDRMLRSPWTATLIGLGVLSAANVASAASACLVPLESDPVDAAAKFEDCVDTVNGGGAFAPNEIVFEGPQSYALKRPLTLERDVVIFGAGQIVAPGPSFPLGESLIVVGMPCPGSSCTGAVDVTIHGLELTSGGTADIRGIDLLATHNLVLNDGHLSDFEVPGAGACIRAAVESELFVNEGLLESCVASTEGGAIFSEATVTIVDGTTLSSNEAQAGGAIATGQAGSSARKLRVWNATLELNHAVFGGAIAAGSGPVNFQTVDSTYLFNSAGDSGGGIYGGGTIKNCTFENNSAVEFGGGAYLRDKSLVYDSTFESNDAWRGGGLAVLAAGNFDMRIQNSTIANNTASGPRSFPWGAGIFVGRGVLPITTGVTYIRNSTVSGNEVDMSRPDGIGGGLGLSGVAATVEHTTFFGNLAQDSGGGIYTSSVASSALTLRSSIVAGSNGGMSTPGACSLGPSFQSTTSLDDDGSCGVAFSNIDPLLAPLSDNGGPTRTHKPSAAEVFGTAICYATVDQRYQARPTTGCDVGAYEE